jgi:hypothetical protein
VVRTVSKDRDDIYGKRDIWVRQDCCMGVKIVYYDKNQRLLKTLTKAEIVQKDGIWTAMRLEMVNVQDDHKSIMEVLKIQYNLDLKDSFFTVGTLERGVM